MNFKVNNVLSFGANYRVWGGKTPKETGEILDKKINQLENQRRIAVQAQEYFETPKIQAYIEQLPSDTFVYLDTTLFPEENNKIMERNPRALFTYRKPGAYQESADFLHLTLNKMNVLEKKKIDNWFEKLLNMCSSNK